MHHYDAASTRPVVDTYIRLDPPAPGDFAAGLRTRVRLAAAPGAFSTGMSGLLAEPTRAVGDFANGAHSHPRAPASGDFASGMRTRDRAQTRAGAAQRPRSHNEHENARWAAA